MTNLVPPLIVARRLADAGQLSDEHIAAVVSQLIDKGAEAAYLASFLNACKSYRAAKGQR